MENDVVTCCVCYEPTNIWVLHYNSSGIERINICKDCQHQDLLKRSNIPNNNDTKFYPSPDSLLQYYSSPTCREKHNIGGPPMIFHWYNCDKNRIEEEPVPLPYGRVMDTIVFSFEEYKEAADYNPVNLDMISRTEQAKNKVACVAMALKYLTNRKNTAQEETTRKGIFELILTEVKSKCLKFPKSDTWYQLLILVALYDKIESLNQVYNCYYNNKYKVHEFINGRPVNDNGVTEEDIENRIIYAKQFLADGKSSLREVQIINVEDDDDDE